MKTKICSTCKNELDISSFQKREVSKDGYRGQCKACRKPTFDKYKKSKKGKLSKKQWEDRNKVKINKTQKEWRDNNKDKMKVIQKRYRTNNPDSHRKYLMQKYGITEKIYDLMVKVQKGKCLICKEKPKRLYVDHCHETNIVRGLLCNKCNQGIGYFKDSINNLKNAIAYLNPLRSLIK